MKWGKAREQRDLKRRHERQAHKLVWVINRGRGCESMSRLFPLIRPTSWLGRSLQDIGGGQWPWLSVDTYNKQCFNNNNYITITMEINRKWRQWRNLAISIGYQRACMYGLSCSNPFSILCRDKSDSRRTRAYESKGQNATDNLFSLFNENFKPLWFSETS